MIVGEKRTFLRRDSDMNVITENGTVISADKVTSDGLPYVEVKFSDGIRKYSTLHI